MKRISKNVVGDRRYTADRVSLRECLGIFKNMKLPWGLMVAGILMSLLASYATLQVSSFSGAAVDSSGAIPMQEMVIYILTSLFVVLCTGGMMWTSTLAD